MTQDERWLAKHNEIMAFMAENHRRPSKYYLEERNNWNWMRHQTSRCGTVVELDNAICLFEDLRQEEGGCTIMGSVTRWRMFNVRESFPRISTSSLMTEWILW